MWTSLFHVQEQQTPQLYKGLENILLMTPLKIMTRRSLSLGVSQNEGSFHRDARRKSWGVVTSQATRYRKACSHAPHIWKPTKQLTKNQADGLSRKRTL